MRLHLINPFNPLVSMSHAKQSRWHRYRVWKPLGLLTLAGLTPPDWEVTVFDENFGMPNYAAGPAPDLVGVTAFTSQANRAYEVAAEFRSRGVSVVMGGIHATVRPDEALQHVDSVVTGEAESVWATVLEDARHGRLQRTYAGGYADMAQAKPARHDLLTKGYAFGAIQTTRGCPLNCSFCSVSAMNGKRYRHRPIDDVIRELRTVREKLVLIVDDNLIGIGAAHVERAKELMRAMIRAKLGKKWICQVTINMADDEELLALAVKAGCKGVFIGFESPTNEGLAEVGKEFNVSKGRDLRASVRRIQRHKIGVMGSFIMGLDTDTPGIGRRIAHEPRVQYVSFAPGIIKPIPRLQDRPTLDNTAGSFIPGNSSGWRLRRAGLACNSDLLNLHVLQRSPPCCVDRFKHALPGCSFRLIAESHI